MVLFFLYFFVSQLFFYFCWTTLLNFLIQNLSKELNEWINRDEKQKTIKEERKWILTCCECDEVGVTFPKLPELLWWCVVKVGVMGISWLLAAEDELFRLLGLMLRVEFWAGELPLPVTINKVGKIIILRVLFLLFYSVLSFLKYFVFEWEFNSYTVTALYMWL